MNMVAQMDAEGLLYQYWSMRSRVSKGISLEVLPE
jgi:hypothetical protein